MLADRIRADPQGFLLGSEDWTQRDTVVRRIRAVKILLLDLLGKMQQKRTQIENEPSTAAASSKIVKDLMFEANRIIRILEYGIPVHVVEAELRDSRRIDTELRGGDLVDNEARCAAILFAEMERASNTRNWRSKLPKDPETRRRLAELEYLCLATGTTVETLVRELKNRVDRKTVSSLDEKLDKCKLELQMCRAEQKRLVEDLKKVPKSSSDFEVLDAKRQRLKHKTHEVLDSKKELEADRADHNSSVSDLRTIRRFVSGKNNQAGKLAAIRDYFLEQLDQRDPDLIWLFPYIESFFEAVSLRWAREPESGSSIEG